ncbi:MAG: response regulator [Candidatus Omnitrophota bacterium]
MKKEQTILIVEDDKRIIDLIQSAIGKIGPHYIIKKAHNGKEALEIIETEKIDLALLDIMMPVMSGAQLLTELCNRKIWFPIIIITGYGINEIENKFLDFGIIDLLLKPFNLSDLKTKIEDVLKRSQQKDSISGMSLSAIMQVLEMERRTGIMTIKTSHKTGRIFFKKGNVVDIEAEGDIGEEILAEFLDYTGNDKEINIEYLSHKRKEKLDKTLMEALFEASKFLDEKRGQIMIASRQPAEMQQETPIRYADGNTPPKPIPVSPSPKPQLSRVETPALLTSHRSQKSKPKRWAAVLATIIVVMVAAGLYTILAQKIQLREQQKQQTHSKQKFESDLADLKAKYLKQLNEIESQKATTREEQIAKEESIKKLNQLEKDETRKAIEKQQAKWAELKKLEQELKNKKQEMEKPPLNEQVITKKIDEPLKNEAALPLPVPESLPKKDQENHGDEFEKVTEGQLISIFLVSEKPELIKGENPILPPSFQRKYNGLRLSIRVVFLVTENGTARDIKILTKIPVELEPVISRSLKKWKFKPARKNNVKIKVWYSLDVKIVF